MPDVGLFDQRIVVAEGMRMLFELRSEDGVVGYTLRLEPGVYDVSVIRVRLLEQGDKDA